MLNNITNQITVAQMAPHIHSFKIGENKVDKISDWLVLWIKKSLESGKIKPYDLLPSKGDLAFHIGVSQGTMQNVFRKVEDLGLVESKQRIGTYIKDDKELGVEKLTSKRECAVEEIKKFLINNNYKIGDVLISTRKLAQQTGISNTTIRMAITNLNMLGVLKQVEKNFIIQNLDFNIDNVETKTLVVKIAEKIEEYINNNSKNVTKLPANTEFAEIFGVSVKTIHDAIKILVKKGILKTRRGRYGTTVVIEENNSEQYFYERVELKIRHYIASNCEVGSKLPSIANLAQEFSVSAKTIKKALDNLAEDGYVTFSRGRYGGTFVTDMPQEGQEAYKWLALNPEFVQDVVN